MEGYYPVHIKSSLVSEARKKEVGGKVQYNAVKQHYIGLYLLKPPPDFAPQVRNLAATK